MSSTNDTFYDIKFRDIDQSKEIEMREYAGKVLIVVNVASRCGLTKTNYTQLNDIYQRYHDRGLEILAFPCNQFKHQEPGTAEEIKQFAQEYACSRTSFPLFEKVDVNGDNAHPLFKYLKHSLPGILGTEGLKWNFTKFLIDRNGKPFKRYAPTTSPESIVKDIESLL